MNHRTVKVAFFSVAIVAMMLMIVMGMNNKANRLEKAVTSAVADIENVHDATHKIIVESFNIVKLSREDYDKYLAAYVEGREALGAGSGWLWVQDNVTQNDRSAYMRLLEIVENNRNKLAEANKRSNLVSTSYNTYISQSPQNVILFWRDEVEITQITSARSKAALEAGEDNEILIQ